MKKKMLFVVINALLVLVVGLLLGLTVINGRSFDGVVLGYILLLVTLCAPTIVFFANQPMNSPLNVGSLLFIVVNVAANVVFMCINPALNAIAITEASICGVFLVYLLILVGMSKKE